MSNGINSLIELAFLFAMVTKCVLDVSIVVGRSDHALVCDRSAPRYVYEAEKKHNIDFTRANDIGILDFLRVSLNIFHVFFEMNGELVDKLGIFFPDMSFLHVSIRSPLRDESNEGKRVHRRRVKFCI